MDPNSNVIRGAETEDGKRLDAHTPRSIRFYDYDGHPITYGRAIELDIEHTKDSDAWPGRVGDDYFEDFLQGWVRVSTVWTGYDTTFMPEFDEGPPKIYETMIFGGKRSDLDGYQWKYATRNQAEEGHRDVCKVVQLVAEGHHRQGQRRAMFIGPGVVIVFAVLLGVLARFG